MISSFYYNGWPFDEWEFQDTKLNGVNLLVGASGSGKTRYLNSIFNISSSIVQGQPFRSGRWELIVKTDEYEYLWEYDGGENQVQREIVARKRIDSQEQFENLIDRTPDTFSFCGDIAILHHLRDVIYCCNLGKWKYFFCRMPSTNRSLICSKLVVHNA